VEVVAEEVSMPATVNRCRHATLETAAIPFRASFHAPAWCRSSNRWHPVPIQSHKSAQLPLIRDDVVTSYVSLPGERLSRVTDDRSLS
jgi:hypothetical protein